MHGTLPAAAAVAIKAADTSVSETFVDDRFVIDAGAQWFSRIAQGMWDHKPGLALHLETDCGERNGHRYASGDVAVPSFVVRQLLRGLHGHQWLNAIMDGSGAEWWAELQRHADIGRRVEQITRRE